MYSFKAVISNLFLLLMAHTCQCNLTATLGTLHQDGDCDSTIFSLGSLAVARDGKNTSIGGTFQLLTALDSNHRVGLSFYQLKPNQKTLVSARSGVLCSAIGDFQWLLHDITIEPRVEECPVPAGSYTVEGFQFDNERFKFFEKGNYEIAMQLFHEDKLICGAKVDMKLA